VGVVVSSRKDGNRFVRRFSAGGGRVTMKAVRRGRGGVVEVEGGGYAKRIAAAVQARLAGMMNGDFVTEAELLDWSVRRALLLRIRR
jgi:hypothetical protein